MHIGLFLCFSHALALNPSWSISVFYVFSLIMALYSSIWIHIERSLLFQSCYGFKSIYWSILVHAHVSGPTMTLHLLELIYIGLSLWLDSVVTFYSHVLIYVGQYSDSQLCCGFIFVHTDPYWSIFMLLVMLQLYIHLSGSVLINVRFSSSTMAYIHLY